MAEVLAYQRFDSKLTLEQGQSEYYASRDDLVGGRGISESAREFFRCHDAAHVVFGCSMSLTNEAMVKIWSFCGTTAGFGLLRDYRSPASKEIYETLEWGPIVRTALRASMVVPRVFARCRRMHKRWPWSDFDLHRQVALSELRREYGIEVLTIP